jgi:DNA-binding response OmpR family regulator
MGSEKKKIFIADDERPLANALKMKLEKSGFATEVVYDGQAALEAVKKVDGLKLFLLDLKMPRLDGFAVLEEIKKRKLSIPVFVLSNYSQEQDVKRALELGAKKFFVKSDVTLATVVKEITKYLAD